MVYYLYLLKTINCLKKKSFILYYLQIYNNDSLWLMSVILIVLFKSELNCKCYNKIHKSNNILHF